MGNSLGTTGTWVLPLTALPSSSWNWITSWVISPSTTSQTTSLVFKFQKLTTWAQAYPSSWYQIKNLSHSNNNTINLCQIPKHCSRFVSVWIVYICSRDKYLDIVHKMLYQFEIYKSGIYIQQITGNRIVGIRLNKNRPIWSISTEENK